MTTKHIEGRVEPDTLVIGIRSYKRGAWQVSEPSRDEIEHVVGGVVDAYRHETFEDIEEGMRARTADALSFLLSRGGDA